jgi:hypothetical protein
MSGRSAVWLAHLVWDQGAGGSNPLAPTIFSTKSNQLFLNFSLVRLLHSHYYQFKRIINVINDKKNLR